MQLILVTGVYPVNLTHQRGKQVLPRAVFGVKLQSVAGAAFGDMRRYGYRLAHAKSGQLHLAGALQCPQNGKGLRHGLPPGQQAVVA